MLEQLFFITVSVAIFGIMFYKMIKKNETGYIYLLILGALGIIIDGIGIVANVNANIFLTSTLLLLRRKARLMKR